MSDPNIPDPEPTPEPEPAPDTGKTWQEQRHEDSYPNAGATKADQEETDEESSSS